MSSISCPYCEKIQEVCHDDGFGYDEDVRHEMRCVSCEKKFVFQTTISITYEEFKADCLNGSSHRLQYTFTRPIEYTRMMCQDCSYSRKCTAEELTELISKQ